MIITTRSIVSLHAGGTYHTGFLETVSTNHLGQTCYTVDGQCYSDPSIWQELSVGQFVQLRKWNEVEQKFEYILCRITTIAPIQQTGKFQITVQIWIGHLRTWSEPREENYNDLKPAYWQEPIPTQQILAPIK